MATQTNLQKEVQRIALEKRLMGDGVVEFNKERGIAAPTEMTTSEPSEALLNLKWMRSTISVNTIKAFDAFGLNPNKPWHWVAFVEAAAEAIFKSAGRGDDWDGERYKELYDDIRAVKQNKNLPTDTSVAIALRSEKATKVRYGHLSVATLRKRISKASDPQHNPFVDRIDSISDKLEDNQFGADDASKRKYATQIAAKSWEKVLLRDVIEEKFKGPLSSSQIDEIVDQLSPIVRGVLEEEIPRLIQKSKTVSSHTDSKR